MTLKVMCVWLTSSGISMKHSCNSALCNKSNLAFCPQRHVSTPREHQYSLKVIFTGCDQSQEVCLLSDLGNTRYSKLTAALHGYLAKARLSCSTCFVLSIRNKYSNEISCRRVDRLVSPSWFVADSTVAEMACRRDDCRPFFRTRWTCTNTQYDIYVNNYNGNFVQNSNIYTQHTLS